MTLPTQAMPNKALRASSRAKRRQASVASTLLTSAALDDPMTLTPSAPPNAPESANLEDSGWTPHESRAGAGGRDLTSPDIHFNETIDRSQKAHAPSVFGEGDSSSVIC